MRFFDANLRPVEIDSGFKRVFVVQGNILTVQ